MTNGLKLSEAEIQKLFDGGAWANRPFLTLTEVTELLSIPKGTIYDWRSRGLLDNCSRKVGKQVLFVRDHLIQEIFNQGLFDQ
ncbi:MAG: helix-turn-helix domain-containing protein [Planctomycetales bacterium]|jgi:hypothetical protein